MIDKTIWKVKVDQGCYIRERNFSNYNDECVMHSCNGMQRENSIMMTGEKMRERRPIVN